MHCSTRPIAIGWTTRRACYEYYRAELEPFTPLQYWYIMSYTTVYILGGFSSRAFEMRTEPSKAPPISFSFNKLSSAVRRAQYAQNKRDHLFFCQTVQISSARSNSCTWPPGKKLGRIRRSSHLTWFRRSCSCRTVSRALRRISVVILTSRGGPRRRTGWPPSIPSFAAQLVQPRCGPQGRSRRDGPSS